MPTYQYACTECAHRFEQVQSFSDDALTTCPTCQGRLRKLFNAVGVVFKGSGFYRNDSRADAEKTPAVSAGSGESKGSEESKGSGDAKGTGETKGSGDAKGSGEKSATTPASKPAEKKSTTAGSSAGSGRGSSSNAT